MADVSDNQGARGRRWRVSIGLTALGFAAFVYGLIDRYWLATIAGLVLMALFGLVASGVHKLRVQSAPITVEADFNAPPPPEEAGRVYRLKRKR